ncbi:hypothetical protein [Sphingomonas leidyi]|uniref:hypothetical protein n=1 Tax=Sphingomonas leidyi TaxID=68569 RepID=UPI0036D2B271
MSRARRSFKLRLSPAGLDILIDSHCHLIRVTRSLIAWGTTLHVAIEYLNSMPTDKIVDQLKGQELSCLGGAEEHHVGASCRLRDIATSITERVHEELTRGQATPARHNLHRCAHADHKSRARRLAERFRSGLAIWSKNTSLARCQ